MAFSQVEAEVFKLFILYHELMKILVQVWNQMFLLVRVRET